MSFLRTGFHEAGIHAGSCTACKYKALVKLWLHSWGDLQPGKSSSPAACCCPSPLQGHQHREQDGGRLRKKTPGKPKQPTSMAPTGCAQQRGRFVFCSLKAAPSPGKSPALSIPRDRSLPWRREGHLAALLPGAEAGRAVPGFPPALDALGAVPWQSWANQSCCRARRERENSSEELCRASLALPAQSPSTENTEPQQEQGPYPVPALLAPRRATCPIGIPCLQRAADAPKVPCS